MSEEKKQEGSVEPTGNPNTNGPEANSFGAAGQPSGQQPEAKNDDNNTSGTVSEEQYKNLEKKLGEQGSELGDLRERDKKWEEFRGQIEPLMTRLEKDPELIDLIVKDKISSKLAKDVLDGKVSKGDAETVSEAHKEVKKEMGKEDYEKATPEQIEKNILEKVGNLLDEKLNKTSDTFNKKLTDAEKMQEHMKETDEFAKNTPDIEEYAPRIVELLKERPEIKKLSDLYHIAKGEKLSKDKEDDDEKTEAEKAKELALNASGGSSQNTAIIKDQNIIDTLIGKTDNPNSF